METILTRCSIHGDIHGMGELAEEQQRLKHKAINKKIPNAYEAANMTSSSGGKQNRKDTCEHELVYIYLYI